MSENNSFGINVKILRKSKNMTQQDLADYLQVTPNTVGNWESGRSFPPITGDAVGAMNVLFGVQPGDLLGCTPNEILSRRNAKERADLSEEERDLLHLFRRLNAKGRERVIQFTEDLLGNSNYTEIEGTGEDLAVSGAA